MNRPHQLAFRSTTGGTAFVILQHAQHCLQVRSLSIFAWLLPKESSKEGRERRWLTSFHRV